VGTVNTAKARARSAEIAPQFKAACERGCASLLQVAAYLSWTGDGGQERAGADRQLSLSGCRADFSVQTQAAVGAPAETLNALGGFGAIGSHPRSDAVLHHAQVGELSKWLPTSRAKHEPEQVRSQVQQPDHTNITGTPASGACLATQPIAEPAAATPTTYIPRK
jgi:hypothetical protein